MTLGKDHEKGGIKMPELIKKMFKVDLQMFNDGGASGAEASSAATESAPKVETKPNGSNRRSKSGELSNVVYGKQESTPSDDTTASLDTEGISKGAEKTETSEETPEERRKAYNDFIAKYKDIDQERFQDTFNRRFKEVKAMETELAEHKEVMDMLKGVYGGESVADVKKAFEEDYEYWERIAEEQGLTYEQFQTKRKQEAAMRKLERENAEFKAIRDRQIGEQKVQQQLKAWNEEAKAVKEMYPSFDINAEVQNRAFVDMLKNGISMEHAYKVLHYDELMQNATMVAAQTADARAQAKIKQKASRPSENGTSSKSAVIVKNDVANLTRKDRAEIARRVARGEKIVF